MATAAEAPSAHNHAHGSLRMSMTEPLTGPRTTPPPARPPPPPPPPPTLPAPLPVHGARPPSNRSKTPLSDVKSKRYRTHRPVHHAQRRGSCTLASRLLGPDV